MYIKLSMVSKLVYKKGKLKGIKIKYFSITNNQLKL